MTRPAGTTRPGITGTRPGITAARPTILIARSLAQAVPPAPPPPDPPVTVGGFYDGVTTTDVVWPTGAGWTSGAESTILANIQALINSSGNGDGPQGGGITHYVRHLPAAGATYPVNGNINLTGRSYLIFEGGGAEVDTGTDVTVGGITRWRITSTGHSGGATIRGSGSPTASPNHAGSVFFTRLLANSPTATDIRFHCLTIEGSSTNHSTVNAGNGGERQHAFCLGGVNGAWIDHCITQKNKGDGVYITDSYLGNSNGYRSRDIRITHSILRQNGRMLVALIWGDDTIIEDNLFSDACYAHVDVEPNNLWETCDGIRVARNTFLDWGWDPSFYGSPFMTTTPVDGLQFTGAIDLIDNVLVGASRTTGRPAEWNSDFTFTPYSVFTKTGLTTITGNVSLRQKPGPAVYASRNAGGMVVTNNKGFLASGAFLGGSAGGSVTQSGNT